GSEDEEFLCDVPDDLLADSTDVLGQGGILRLSAFDHFTNDIGAGFLDLIEAFRHHVVYLLGTGMRADDRAGGYILRIAHELAAPDDELCHRQMVRAERAVRYLRRG